MSTAETEWEPGDPLMPDHGLNGGISTIFMSEVERARALEADTGTPPPWWRPEPDGPTMSYTRTCSPCGVRWRGDEPCWMCGGEQLP